MIAHPENIRLDVLRLLKDGRGSKEISTRLGLSVGAIEDWAAAWRKTGELKAFKRPGSEFTAEAKRLSNGYYKSIRKRYLGMKWLDYIEKRHFGFASPVEAIHFYLDEQGSPRACAYCGRLPMKDKVWGLDRLDSSIGHVPGNLVPCCGNHPENRFMSCQVSKSKFSLYGWLETNISRSLGRPATIDETQARVNQVEALAQKFIRG